ncbi:protein PELOTA 1-like [Actinidia eriantha]|uniref:protein PELOTA 1-like n=1 Tax=Actinidia eriantha TaxID=165200 RepID=UPI0025868F6B|nr:protein PELOTA 1-like [Actinidia eriantha]
MKLLERQFSPNKTGSVKIILEEPDDVWLAYNLIAVGDVIGTQTTRKIHRTTSTGKRTSSSRVQVKLQIKVTAVHYDGNSILRVSGKNRLETEHVTAGSFHTLELETGKEFTVEKKLWNAQAVEILEEGGNYFGSDQDKSTVEIRVKEFMEMVSIDSDRVCYGLKGVEVAHELAAIETLFITDELFRSTDLKMRKKFEELVRAVKKGGGKAMMVSSKQLAKLTGVGAILRFPVPDIDDLEL